MNRGGNVLRMVVLSGSTMPWLKLLAQMLTTIATSTFKHCSGTTELAIVQNCGYMGGSKRLSRLTVLPALCLLVGSQVTRVDDIGMAKPSPSAMMLALSTRLRFDLL